MEKKFKIDLELDLDQMMPNVGVICIYMYYQNLGESKVIDEYYVYKKAYISLLIV